MWTQLLIPGVQHQSETDFAAKLLLPKFEQCLGCGSEQKF
jgi:hypothetical protein